MSEYKIVVIGDSYVGKTSLIQRYVTNSYNTNQIQIGIDLFTKTLEIDGINIKLKIWDTVGQEKYDSMPFNFFRGAQGALVVFDVTNKKSFESAKTWAKRAVDKSEPGACIMLVAAKIDNAKERVISAEDSSMLAEQNKYIHAEVSAKDNRNVSECFYNLASTVSQSFKVGECSALSSDNFFPLEAKPVEAQDSKKCCY